MKNTDIVTFSDVTLEEAEILNSEVTDEIYECLLEAKKKIDRENREQDQLQRMVSKTLDKIQAYTRGEVKDREMEFNRFLDLGATCDEYFNRINELTKKRDTALAVYIHWNNRYQNGRRHLEEYKAGNGGYITGYRYWDLYNMVKANRTKAWIKYESIRNDAKERLSDLWDTVKSLPEFHARADMAEYDKSLWPKYFELITGEEREKYDPRAHKKDAPHIDNRMLVSDEAYCKSHIK